MILNTFGHFPEANEWGFRSDVDETDEITFHEWVVVQTHHVSIVTHDFQLKDLFEPEIAHVMIVPFALLGPQWVDAMRTKSRREPIEDMIYIDEIDLTIGRFENGDQISTKRIAGVEDNHVRRAIVTQSIVKTTQFLQ